MIVTRSDYLKRYQNSLLRPALSASNHSRSADTTPFQAHEQPMPGIVTDPVLSQARAEEQFYAEQLSSGYQIVTSGIVESAAQFINKQIYEEAVRQELSALEANEEQFFQQQGYPAQPSTPQHPQDPFMPAPGTIPGLGGY